MTGRVLLFAGASTTTAGLLLLFGAVETGWPAFPIVAGFALAALAWPRAGHEPSPVGDAIRRIAVGWGAIAVITGLAWAVQLAGPVDVAALASAHWYGLVVIAAGACVGVEAVRLWPGRTRAQVATAMILSVAGAATVLHGLIVLLGY